VRWTSSRSIRIAASACEARVQSPNSVFPNVRSGNARLFGQKFVAAGSAFIGAAKRARCSAFGPAFAGSLPSLRVGASALPGSTCAPVV
jgi:hypothetical protein